MPSERAQCVKMLAAKPDRVQSLEHINIRKLFSDLCALGMNIHYISK